MSNGLLSNRPDVIGVIEGVPCHPSDGVCVLYEEIGLGIGPAVNEMESFATCCSIFDYGPDGPEAYMTYDLDL